VLTFDDGSADFYSRTFPILQEFGWPATVYLTSSYANYNRPVFAVMCWYLFWKARGTTVNLEGLITGRTSFELNSSFAWEAASQAVREFSRNESFSAKRPTYQRALPSGANGDRHYIPQVCHAKTRPLTPRNH